MRLRFSKFSRLTLRWGFAVWAIFSSDMKMCVGDTCLLLFYWVAR